MLMWPSSTAPVRPASESVRSVPAPTIRTLSAASKTSAILRIRARLGVPVEQHGVEDELLELGERHPGFLRGRSPGTRRSPTESTSTSSARAAARVICWRRLPLLGESEPSFAFSGAQIEIARRPRPRCAAAAARPRGGPRAGPRARRGRRSARTTAAAADSAAPRDLLDHRLDQRPRERRRADATCHPGWTPTRPLDEQPGVLVYPRIAHAR